MGRLVRCYSKDDESLVSEIALPDIDLRVLQDAFGIDESNPMYDCYPIGLSQVAVLNNWCNSSIDCLKYDCLLEYESE